LNLGTAYRWEYGIPYLEMSFDKYASDISAGYVIGLFDDKFSLGVKYGSDFFQGGFGFKTKLFSNLDGNISYSISREKFTETWGHNISLEFDLMPKGKTDSKPQIETKKPKETPKDSTSKKDVKEEPKETLPDFTGWTLFTYNGVDWQERYSATLSERIEEKFSAKHRTNYSTQSVEKTQIKYPKGYKGKADFINNKYLENRGTPVLDESLDKTIKIIIGKDIIDLP
jgi:hypothetical protein